MDGLTAIRSIQQSRPDLPIIIASGTKRETERLQRPGENLINLGKPYTIESLLTAVAKMIRRECVEAGA